MVHELSPLPYAQDALEPVISKETLDFHHGKHHNTCVTKLNGLIPGTPFESMTLEQIIMQSEGGIFNNAAQIWNHTFYWNSLRAPRDHNAPTGDVAAAIDAAFGAFDAFKEQFSAAAANNFGSGWTWLVKHADGSLGIVNTANAGTPMTAGQHALLTVDVWEHAYYIDYRNARPQYLEEFWKIVNWDHAAEQLTGA